MYVRYHTNSIFLSLECVLLQVLAGDMDLLHLSEELVVVNKLPSIPVHPVGNFKVSFRAYMHVCVCVGHCA